MALISGETWTDTINSYDVEYFKVETLTSADIQKWGAWHYGWTAKDSATGLIQFEFQAGSATEPSQQDVEDTYWAS